MDLQWLLISAVLSLLAWIALQRFRLFSKMAPGPYGLPIVGSMIHLIRVNAIEELHRYKEKYGKVFSLAAGNYYITVVCDYKLIIANLKKDEFQGRPDFDIWQKRNKGNRNRGVLVCDGGPVWNEQRRFALRSLRDFGFGKESMEGMLITELQNLQNELRKDLGHPMGLSGVFNASVLNSLWYIVTGERFEFSDPKLRKLISLIIESVRNALVTSPGLFFYGPVKYGLIASNLDKMFSNFFAEIEKLLNEVIESHLKTYKEGEIRNFVDAYIKQINESQSGSSFYAEEGKMNLYSVLFDLFVAGSETTSTTLQWAMLYLSHHPEVQKKAQAEIDNVIGRSRPPSRSDKPQLVYLEAVMNEVHRCASLIPYSVYHRAVQDSSIGGHFIPKDSVLFFSLREAHYDKDVWGDPERFRPERFLDPSGTKPVRHEALIPFSSGKRQCLGETLARDTLFIFLTGLLQTFTFEIDPDCPNNDMKGSDSFVCFPNPYKVIIKERK